MHDVSGYEVLHDVSGYEVLHDLTGYEFLHNPRDQTCDAAAMTGLQTEKTMAPEA